MVNARHRAGKKNRVKTELVINMERKKSDIVLYGHQLCEGKAIEAC